MRLKLLVVLLGFSIGLLAGCNNGVICSTPFTDVVTADAARAKAVLDDVQANTLTPREARDYIPMASSALAKYSIAMTVNPFAYSFSDGKSMLVTPKWYRLIERSIPLANSATYRREKVIDSLVCVYAEKLAKIIYDIDLARRGDLQ